MHPYRSPGIDADEPRAEASEVNLHVALGVLVAVSLVQLVTAYHVAGGASIQTLAGGGFLAAGLWGLSRRRAARAQRRR